MRKRLINLFLLGLLLTGCNENIPTYESVKVEQTANEGDLGEFALLSPANQAEVIKDIPSFTWEASENANYYTLEICLDSSFDDADSSYFKKSGITSTSYTLDTYLKKKETMYYWRVTAISGKHSKVCSDEYKSFFLKTPDYGEIEFTIDDADEWKVHEQGSQCKVSIDRSDFFNNGKNSLMIAYDETQTKTGNVNSDGWMVITHTQETELYGVDAFYFNFYYNGQDANVFFRVIDEDNEYYHSQIKLAKNAQQTVIIKFSDFELRTKGGTPIVNQVFDYNYIKSVELVFEQSFGDGICMVSNLKAIHYDDYKYLFMEEVNFDALDKENAVMENYTKFVPSTSNEGKSLTISYGGDINGYGFYKIPVNMTLVEGDAFRVKVSATGLQSANILFRIIEEDGDRWVYKQKVSTLPEGDFYIPFIAFTLSEANGDGARQFYFIKQFQFGIEGTYQQGSFTYEKLEVATLADNVENLYINQIGTNGLIENFDEYQTSVEMYYKWQETANNKDEQMAIDTQYKTSAIGKSGKFTYKSDMYAATYGIQFADGVEGFNSLKFDVLDKSVLKNTSGTSTDVFAYLGDAAAKLIVTLYVKSGATYTYVIQKLPTTWTTYEIKFSDFALDSGSTSYSASALESKNVVGLSFSLQYYYYYQDGGIAPQYTSGNPVYFDNIYLAMVDTTNSYEVISKVKPSKEDAKIAYIDDFNNYTASMLANNYSMNNGYEYEELTIDTNQINSTNCLKMKYKGNNNSVSYGKFLSLDSSVSAKAIQLDIKGDSKAATMYINIFFDYAGSLYKYRATITNLSNEWTTYTIGFDNFTKIEGSGGDVGINKNTVPNINKITFGIVNSTDYQESYVLVDNIRFNGNVSYGANTRAKIGD